MRNERLLANVQGGSVRIVAPEERVEDGKRKDNSNTGSELKKRAKTQGPSQGNESSDGLQNAVGDMLGEGEYLEEGWFLYSDLTRKIC